MGLFDWLTGKKSASAQAPEIERPNMQLAFVLLSEPRLPAAAEIQTAFSEFGAPGQTLTESRDEDGESKSDHGKEVLMLDVDGAGVAFVMLVPAPVPNGEAEASRDYSLGAFQGEERPPDHAAHLVVTMTVDDDATPTQGMIAFTALLAGVAKASPCTEIYCGNAGATHPRDLFLSLAAEDPGEIGAKIMLWNGVSRAMEPDGRVSMLSKGMHQIALPNLYLVVSQEGASDAFAWMWDILGYVAGRGEAIPAGDTIGASENQFIQVNYVNSPADDGSVVWKIEM
ncbi:MAG: DUF4261 domain-containing protein [Verrucomicrobiota bacterium]